MTRDELKRTLLDQAEIPMTQAVMQKLEYLQSDDVFIEDLPETDEEDLSLEEAFAQSGMDIDYAQAPMYEEPSMAEFERFEKAVELLKIAYSQKKSENEK